ncbi:MAG: response regulator transcription factor [Lachnospiraceae bacterium]|nr:response regulator transcription factor [Lachnospiraceae bacterium]
MHVAICDDNGADRKQLERLLTRESEKRHTDEGTIYADSYGNATNLLANPLQYDAIFIDICHTPGVTVKEIVDTLLEKGVHAPIILCCSLINYREQEYPENVFFLDKAIKAAELSECIDKAIALKAAAPNAIEIRDENTTIYLTEPDILYGIEKNYTVYISLKDGRTISTRGDVFNLYSQWESCETFLPPPGYALINCRYIEKITMFGVRMINGKTFPLPKLYREYAKEIMDQIASGEIPKKKG